MGQALKNKEDKDTVKQPDVTKSQFTLYIRKSC